MRAGAVREGFKKALVTKLNFKKSQDLGKGMECWNVLVCRAYKKRGKSEYKVK